MASAQLEEEIKSQSNYIYNQGGTWRAPQLEEMYMYLSVNLWAASSNLPLLTVSTNFFHGGIQGLLLYLTRLDVWPRKKRAGKDRAAWRQDIVPCTYCQCMLTFWIDCNILWQTTAVPVTSLNFNFTTPLTSRSPASWQYNGTVAYRWYNVSLIYVVLPSIHSLVYWLFTIHTNHTPYRPKSSAIIIKQHYNACTMSNLHVDRELYPPLDHGRKPLLYC